MPHAIATSSRLLILFFTVATILIGCGGGGGGSTPPTYTVSGTLSGYNGNNPLVLQNNNTDDVSLNADGTFSFSTALATSSSYAVTIQSQPGNQTCSVSNASGTVASSNINNIIVSCDFTDQDLQGIYNGTGTGTFNGVNSNTEVTLINVKGMSHGSRFMFFNADRPNPDSNVLYDGQINSITKTDLSGTVDVYQGGQIVESDVAVTGTVITRSQVQLSFAAKGNFLGGSVTATFDTLYDRGATEARVDGESYNFGNNEISDVYLLIPNLRITNFEFKFADNSYRAVSVNFLIICSHTGKHDIPDVNINIYTMRNNLLNGLNCSPLGNNLPEVFDHTGFATVVDDINTDDTLWYATANGTYSVFAILRR